MKRLGFTFCLIIGLLCYTQVIFAESIRYEMLKEDSEEYNSIMNSTPEILARWNNLPVGNETIEITKEDIDYSKLVKVYRGQRLKDLQKTPNLNQLTYVWELPVYKDGNSFIYIFSKKEDNRWSPGSVLIYENETVDYVGSLVDKVKKDPSLLKEEYYFIQDLDYINKAVAIGYKNDKAINIIPVEASSKASFTSTEKSSYSLSADEVYSYDEVVTTIRNTPTSFRDPNESERIDFDYLDRVDIFPFVLFFILSVVIISICYCGLKKKVTSTSLEET